MLFRSDRSLPDARGRLHPAVTARLLAVGDGRVDLDDLRVLPVRQALLERGATPQGRKELAEATGITGTLILEWVNHVDLYRVKGVGSEYADLLEISGANPFRVRAYRNAIKTIKDLGRPVKSMVGGEEDLTDLPGIGKDISAQILELFQEGDLPGIREIEEIFKDIDEARQTFPHIRSIFLIDGNVLALKTEFLLKILRKIDHAIAGHPVTKQEVLVASPW